MDEIQFTDEYECDPETDPSDPVGLQIRKTFRISTMSTGLCLVYASGSWEVPTNYHGPVVGVPERQDIVPCPADPCECTFDCN